MKGKFMISNINHVSFGCDNCQKPLTYPQLALKVIGNPAAATDEEFDQFVKMSEPSGTLFQIMQERANAKQAQGRLTVQEEGFKVPEGKLDIQG